MQDPSSRSLKAAEDELLAEKRASGVVGSHRYHDLETETATVTETGFSNSETFHTEEDSHSDEINGVVGVAKKEEGDSAAAPRSPSRGMACTPPRATANMRVSRSKSEEERVLFVGATATASRGSRGNRCVRRSKTDGGEARAGAGAGTGLQLMRDTARIRKSESAAASVSSPALVVTGTSTADVGEVTASSTSPYAQLQLPAEESAHTSGDYLDDYMFEMYDRDCRKSWTNNNKNRKGSMFENSALQDLKPLPQQPAQQQQQQQQQQQNQSAIPGAYPYRPGGGGPASSSLSLQEEVEGSAPSDMEQGRRVQPSYMDNHDLVQAMPVVLEDQQFPQAQPVEDQDDIHLHHEKDKTCNTKFQAMVAICFVICGIVILVLSSSSSVVSKGGGTSDSESTNTPSNQTISTNQSDILVVLDLPLNLPNWTIATIQNHVNSPQSKAYQWVRNDPWMANYTQQRLLQRYVAATFFFATGGPSSWTNQGGNSVTLLVDAQNSSYKPSQQQQTLHTNVTTNNTTRRQRKLQQPAPSIPNDNFEQVEITSDQWLSYNTNECDWFNTAHADEGAPFCGEDDGLFQYFEMTDNNLVGTIPPQLGLLAESLEGIKFGRDDGLEGTLPTQLGLLTRLKELRVFRTQVRGSIPSQLGMLSNTLEAISIIGSQFTGQLPWTELLQLSKLTSLEANRNQLSGELLPNNIGYKWPLLVKLRVMENKFVGSLPTTLGLCTHLNIIDVEGNDLYGSIPSQLGNLGNLTHLELKNNRFTGMVPSELGLLPVLEELNLENNIGITGSVPLEWNSLGLGETLRLLNVEGTSITGTIPAALCSLPEGGLQFACSPEFCGCDCLC